MIECLECGYCSHEGFCKDGKFWDMKCPNCGSRNLTDDETHDIIDDICGDF